MAYIVTASGFLLGRELVGQTIHSTSSSILSKIIFITENYNHESKVLFERLDLKFKLEMISEYIQNVEKKNKNKNIKMDSTVTKCIKHIKDILGTLETEVEGLQKEIDRVSKQWFGNFRVSQYKTYYHNIESHVTILLERFDFLTKII